MMLDKRLVLILGQNSEVRARFVDGMLADNAGIHIYVGENHVYQQGKYVISRLPYKMLHPGQSAGKGMKSGDSAETVNATLNRIHSYASGMGCHARRSQCDRTSCLAILDRFWKSF